MTGAEAPKRFAVVIRTSEPTRAGEALRAALGLCLRGDRVTVLVSPGARHVLASSDAFTQRCIATLESLGQQVREGDDDAVDALVRVADAAEVWT